jgi:hypothetical protein
MWTKMYNLVSSDYRKLVVNKPCHIILLPNGCLHLEVEEKAANAN